MCPKRRSNFAFAAAQRLFRIHLQVPCPSWPPRTAGHRAPRPLPPARHRRSRPARWPHRPREAPRSTLARTSRASGQSKPTRDARRPSLAARVSAGSARGTPDRARRLRARISARAPAPSAPPTPAPGPRQRSAPAKMCGWRRISFSRIASATAAKSNQPRSSAMRAWNTTWNSRSPSSSRRCSWSSTLDGVGHLVGLLDGVGGDRREGLLPVPGTAALRIAQPCHQRQELSPVPSPASLTAGPPRRTCATVSGAYRRSRPRCCAPP